MVPLLTSKTPVVTKTFTSVEILTFKNTSLLPAKILWCKCAHRNQANKTPKTPMQMVRHMLVRIGTYAELETTTPTCNK